MKSNNQKTQNEDFTTKDLIVMSTTCGIPPILNPLLLTMVAEEKKWISEGTTKKVFRAFVASQPLLLGGLWLGITFAIKRDIKLASIVGGSIAGFCYLFLLCDFLVRSKLGQETDDALRDALSDMVILDSIGTAFVPTILGGVSSCVAEKILTSKG